MQKSLVASTLVTLSLYGLVGTATSASIQRGYAGPCQECFYDEVSGEALGLLQVSEVASRAIKSAGAAAQKGAAEGKQKLEVAPLKFRLHQVLLRGDLRSTFLCTFLVVWGSLWYLCKHAVLPRLLGCCTSEASSKDGREHVWWVPYFCHLVSITAGIVSVVLFYDGLQGRLYFVHIPKNAGTTVERSGLSRGISWGNEDLSFVYSSFQTRMPDGNICSTYHVPPDIQLRGYLRWFQWLDPHRGAETFCVTRNPVDRMLSEYKYLLSDQVSWSSEYATTFRNGLLDYPACSVKGLNHFAQSTLGTLMKGSKYIDDCHHVPQVDYIWDPSGRRQCANILKLDNLKESFDVLMRQRGYPVKLLDDPTSENSASACENLGVLDFTNDTRRLIERVYAQDFEKLGYEPPWSEPLQ